MAEVTSEYTLAKKWRSKKKIKALTVGKLMDFEDEVPQKYAAGLMFAQTLANANQGEPPANEVGALFKFTVETYNVFQMKYDLYAAETDPMHGWRQHYNNLWDFIFNYCFPAMGMNILVCDASNNAVAWTNKPGDGLGNGCKNRATDAATAVKMELALPQGVSECFGFYPYSYTWTETDEEGTTEDKSHNDSGPDSLADVMCQFARFGGDAGAMNNLQAKWKDLQQSHVIPFSGVHDYKIVKKLQYEDSLRFLAMSSEAHKETLIVIKFGIKAGAEYGTIYMNCAYADHPDKLRMKKGNFKVAGWRMVEVLKQLSDPDEGRKFIPGNFFEGLKAIESLPQQSALAFDEGVYNGTVGTD